MAARVMETNKAAGHRIALDRSAPIFSGTIDAKNGWLVAPNKPDTVSR